MSVAGNQRRIFLSLAARLQPHWRTLDFPPRLQAVFSAERRFGSRDRRLYRELLYTTVRYLPWVEPLLAGNPDKAIDTVIWLAADLPATHALRATLGAEWPPCPESIAAKAAVLDADPAALMPAWLSAECPTACLPPEVDALHRRAPLWLRLQTDNPTAIAEELGAHNWNWRPSPLLPTAWEVLTEADVTQTAAYRTGLFDIQDLGSQLILVSAAITPGGRWLDACAGAGGKTLQLARIIGRTGQVDAHDIRPAALEELGRRATRAGLNNVSVLSAPPTGLYDGVLVDAPCSGSGTWRRAPHLKWATTPAMIARHAELQRELLTRFAPLVRHGGRLIYATCSLNRQENPAVVGAFLSANPDFKVEQTGAIPSGVKDDFGLTILPSRHDSDGFYIAALRRS
jgi:16S rRNA (cytosine967-C5)-methyltransferase